MALSVSLRNGKKKLIEKTHLRYRLAMRQERKNLEATGGVMDPTTRLELLGTGLRKTMFPRAPFPGCHHLITIWYCKRLHSYVKSPLGNSTVNRPFFFNSKLLVYQRVRIIWWSENLCCQRPFWGNSGVNLTCRACVNQEMLRWEPPKGPGLWPWHDSGWEEEKLLRRTPVSNWWCQR